MTLARCRISVREKGSKVDVQIGRLLYPESVPRPRTRADCPGARPCPFVSCKHNLYLEVTDAGTIIAPEYPPDQQPPDASCVLDCAARGGMSPDEVAEALGVSRQRVEQVEAAALAKTGPELAGWQGHAPAPSVLPARGSRKDGAA